MEENTNIPDPSPGTCSHCTVRPIAEGHATPLCEECRQAFIQFPIPLWIKLFGGGVGVILLFALFTLPSQLSTAIHLQRGKDAAKAHKFLTAQNELRQALKKIPNSVEAQAYMMISSYYNVDLVEFGNMYQKLETKPIDDHELYSKMEDVAIGAADYFPSDSFAVVMKNHNDSIEAVPDSAFEHFLQRHPEDIFASIQYASKSIDEKENARADTLLVRVLNMNKNQLAALQLLSGLRREEGDFPGSIQYCDQILENNRESVYAIASKARTMLKMHKDQEALEMARKSYEMDKTSGYAHATMCLAYHFNGKINERDELVKLAAKDSAKTYYMGYVLDVINKKETYR